MARIVNEQEYADRRNEILDVAHLLVATKGYEQMSIQDILDARQISKGAFYHYFDSKQALLEAIVQRQLDQVEGILAPIVYSPDLTALEKLKRLFATAGQWKTARKTLMVGLLRGWYMDHNAILRQKLRMTMLDCVTPLLTLIIRQGVGEGVLTTAYPDEIGAVVWSLLYDLSDTIGGLLLAPELGGDSVGRIERIVAVHTDALERVLGAPSGSIEIIDAAMLDEWVVATTQAPESPGKVERYVAH